MSERPSSIARDRARWLAESFLLRAPQPPSASSPQGRAALKEAKEIALVLDAHIKSRKITTKRLARFSVEGAGFLGGLGSTPVTGPFGAIAAAMSAGALFTEAVTLVNDRIQNHLDLELYEKLVSYLYRAQ